MLIRTRRAWRAAGPEKKQYAIIESVHGTNTQVSAAPVPTVFDYVCVCSRVRARGARVTMTAPVYFEHFGRGHQSTPVFSAITVREHNYTGPATRVHAPVVHAHTYVHASRHRCGRSHRICRHHHHHHHQVCFERCLWLCGCECALLSVFMYDTNRVELIAGGLLAARFGSRRAMGSLARTLGSHDYAIYCQRNQR